MKRSLETSYMTLIMKVYNETRCGQIIDGSRDAHYKLLFDDSAFLFNQREKKLCRLLGTLHSD